MVLLEIEMTVINNGFCIQVNRGTDHSPEIDLNSAGNITVVNGAAAIRYPVPIWEG